MQLEPNRPHPEPVSIDSRSTATLVLDLNARCQEPEAPCSKLLEPVGQFLERARAAEIPTIFTIVVHEEGTPIGQVAAPLTRRESEPVFYPEGYDKFWGGQIQDLLQPRGIQTLVVTGASTNFAVLYTCTTALRMYDYTVVLPVDGVIARSDYEQEYSFHQLSILPRVPAARLQFTGAEK